MTSTRPPRASTSSSLSAGDSSHAWDRRLPQREKQSLVTSYFLGWLPWLSLLPSNKARTQEGLLPRERILLSRVICPPACTQRHTGSASPTPGHGFLGRKHLSHKSAPTSASCLRGGMWHRGLEAISVNRRQEHNWNSQMSSWHFFVCSLCLSLFVKKKKKIY